MNRSSNQQIGSTPHLQTSKPNLSSVDENNDKIETDEIKLDLSPEPAMDKVKQLEKKPSEVLKPFEA